MKWAGEGASTFTARKKVIARLGARIGAIRSGSACMNSKRSTDRVKW